MNETQDKTRQFVDLAITAGRIRQSPQTGYVHHFYHTQDEGVNDTIPIYENVLFALALLRTRTADGMNEAKELLTKLLHFQNREEGEFKGNFPIYLHEYPQCKDRFVGTSLLPPFYWILKQYSAVLGSELKQKLTAATRAILTHSLATHKTKPAPFQIALKIAAAFKGFGDLWNEGDLKLEGNTLLEVLKKETEAPDFGSWFSPSHLGEAFVALQVAYSSIAESPWKGVLALAAQNWHARALGYVGPAVKINQWGFEQQTTLLDFYVSLYTGVLPYRAFVNQPLHLQTALIQPTQDVPPPLVLPFAKEGKVAEYQWRVVQEEQFGYSAIQKSVLPIPALEKGFHPLNLIWGDVNRTFSFVCQGGNSAFTDFKAVEGGLDYSFFLSEPLQTDDREKSREIAFFCDQHEDLAITVKGAKATTFQMGDPVRIEDQRMALTLTFFHEGGDGRFMGHIMPVNRPSQQNAKGEHRFTVYDWQISLRTVRRYTPCNVRVEIRIVPKGQ